MRSSISEIDCRGAHRYVEEERPRAIDTHGITFLETLGVGGLDGNGDRNRGTCDDRWDGKIAIVARLQTVDYLRWFSLKPTNRRWCVGGWRPATAVRQAPRIVFGEQGEEGETAGAEKRYEVGESRKREEARPDRHKRE